MAVLFGNFVPPRLLVEIGTVQIYWYGFFIVASLVAAYYVCQSLYLRQHTKDSLLGDLGLYLVAASIIGARLWHVFVFQWDFYSQNPGEIIKIWHGGIAIQGAVIAGALTVYIFSRYRKLRPLYLMDIIAPAVALGQAIGRWGNFFNQELYGWPTSLPWAIYISPENRLPGFESYDYFHPAFLYESILDAALFFLLWSWSKKNRPGSGRLTAWYLIGYGLIRFLTEFVRIDPLPSVGMLRAPQVISIIFICAGSALWASLFLKSRRGSRGRSNS